MWSQTSHLFSLLRPSTPIPRCICLFQRMHFYAVQMHLPRRDHCPSLAHFLIAEENISFFSSFFFMHSYGIQVTSDNQLKIENKKWQMECCCSSFCPSPFLSSHCQGGSVHSGGHGALNEAEFIPLLFSLQFNESAFMGLISIPQRWSSLSDR